VAKVVSVNPSTSTSDFAVEVVASVVANAQRDADCVDRFLRQLGLAATPKKPVHLPREFLAYLGAALRLLAWERSGLFLHRDVGLPGAQQAIGDALRLLDEPDTNVTSFCVAVTKLSVEHFSWSGLSEIGADVALENADEDVLLEALADFLWTHRPD
jgi:hypothetical protein